MSEQKKISPLLDGFVMGDPMSSHDGIHCCPAMRENSEEKYIVKIISVPASQKQLDALLLTGAYPDVASATDYFKEMAEGVVKEAELLKQLSKLEGFLPYDDWQIVPMEGSKLGYQVYLISPYKRSLEKYLSRHNMTHLGAVNLGLDLCAALSICRRAGFMHVDLKPTNIFMTNKRDFRIGDLGFVKLNALKYTSLPSKYCSRYTPPELHDPLNTLNPTADIYAIGMILYQIYNNGVLPFEDQAPAGELPAPLNADYEMAEIILKACDPNPRKRWQTPIELGQALVSYMQRNCPDETPIVPPVAQAEYLDATFESASEQNEETVQPAEEAAEHSSELAFMQELTADETAPEAQDADALESTALTDDVSAILAQADELLADPPEETVQEEPEEPIVNTEEPIENTQEPEFQLENVDFTFDDPCESVAAAASAQEVFNDEEVELLFSEKPRKKRGFLKAIIAIILVAALAIGGYWFYENQYLIHIDSVQIKPFEDTVTVNVSADADMSLLTVTCTDSYGNCFSSSLSDGVASFEDLTPGTLYRVEISVEGFHALKGYQSGTVTTAQRTEILDFSAINGNEDGSVILSFSANGPEQDWIIEYSAEGEEAQSISFTGHAVTVSNLTVGKVYTFKLVHAPGADFYIVGQNTLEFKAVQNVIAEKLAITACDNGTLTAQWETPAGAEVENWSVRCYNDKGYDQTIVVTENTAQFTDIAADAAYTVEVTAVGMTLPARTYISANPVTITDIVADNSVDGKLTVSWNSGNVMPDGGWLLLYTLDSGSASAVIKCVENKAVIEPTVPGATYHITIQPADGATIFGGKHSATTAGSTAFNSKGVNSADVTGSFCPTPAKANWTYKDIDRDAYTATYAPGSKVSMLLYYTGKPAASNDNTTVMFVIRDSEGNPLPSMTNITTASWNSLWNNRSQYCSLNLPAIPGSAGTYTVEVYFNRQLMITKNLTITE